MNRLLPAASALAALVLAGASTPDSLIAEVGAALARMPSSDR